VTHDGIFFNSFIGFSPHHLLNSASEKKKKRNVLTGFCLHRDKTRESTLFIGKLTDFLQLQEFSFRRHTQVVSSPFAVRLSSRSYRAK
jgi:hypothetical protein